MDDKVKGTTGALTLEMVKMQKSLKCFRQMPRHTVGTHLEDSQA